MRKHPQLQQLGHKIRRLRERAGHSQEGFAAEVGLDRAYYGGVERGERNVAALNLVRIAVALNREVGALFPKLSELKQVAPDLGTRKSTGPRR